MVVVWTLVMMILAEKEKGTPTKEQNFQAHRHQLVKNTYPNYYGVLIWKIGIDNMKGLKERMIKEFLKLCFAAFRKIKLHTRDSLIKKGFWKSWGGELIW